eukprot:m.182350 g.182350  ORF g.182350 m.182350 type:complete len:91 (+) comp16884_c1_seq8:128-400(+)
MLWFTCACASKCCDLHVPVLSSKPDMCNAIHARVLIDDALHYAQQCAGHLDHVVLFGKYAWNKAEELPQGVTRAADWAMVLDVIRSLKLK